MLLRRQIIFSGVIIALTVLLGCQGKQEAMPSTSFDPRLIARLDSIGEAFIQEGEVMGISVAVMQGDDTVFNRGFGFANLDRTKLVTNKTRFLMASVSKLMGATVVMKLVEEGKLSLDQTLYELLPDFPNPGQAKAITLRHMLSHTSGLQDYAVEIDSNYVRTGIAPTKEDFYDFFRGRDLNFTPGSNYSYCNSGFLLMGMIVERITETGFQQQVDRVINQPLGAKLKLIAEATKDPEMSQYAELRGSTFYPYPHWTWIKGDGGLTATAIDLVHFPAKWAQGEIVSNASFLEMSTPVVLTDGIETGYGLGVRNGVFLGEKVIGHTGGHKSTYSIMVHFPERDLSFVVFINTDNTPTSVRNVFREFARAVLGKPEPAYIGTQLSPVERTKYTGTYTTFDHKIANTITIEPGGDDSTLNYCTESDCEPMIYLGSDTFWIQKWPYDLVAFHVDKNNKAVALKEYYTGYYAVLRKRSKE